MQLSSQAILNIILAIIGTILGSILGLIGFMWHHFNSQFKEMRGEMKDIEIRLTHKIDVTNQEIKEMEVRLTNKLDGSHKSLNAQISNDRDRISQIEGYLALSPTTPPQVAITAKKKYRPQAKVASA